MNTPLPIHVLLVEDNPTDVLLTQEALRERRQFDVTVAERLGTALELLKTRYFDVLLLDLGLPDCQGLETFLKLRRGNSNIPIIVMTAKDDDELALQAVHAGAQDYLVKHQVHGEILVRSIRYSIERQGAERRLAAEHAVGRILALVHDVKDAALKVLQVLCESLAWDVGTVWLTDQKANVLRGVETWHKPGLDVAAFEEGIRQRTLAPGVGLPGRVWASGKVVWVPDVSVEANFPHRQVAVQSGLHGAVGFPIQNGVQGHGVLEFFSREVRQPDNALIEMMTSIGNYISQFIERRQAEETVQEQNHERRLARQIQEGLLPKVMPAVPGFEIAGRVRFATEVGGDYFDIMPMQAEGQDCLGIAIGDASGHGLASALLITETRAYLRALSLTVNQPNTMLALSNRRILDGAHFMHLVTLLLVRLDPRKKALVYAGAGHRPGYVLDDQGETKAVLSSAGLPLGVDLSSEFPLSPEVALEPGDLAVLFTDGIVETLSPEGEEFGNERLLASIRKHRERSSDEILDALFQEVADYSQRAAPLDDATAVIIKVEATR